jgi:hypothetical protein
MERPCKEQHYIELYIKIQSVPHSKRRLGYKNLSVNVVQGNNRCFVMHTRHLMIALCGQNVEFSSVKPGGTESDHWIFKG